VQAAELYDAEKQKENKRALGTEEILQVLQAAHGASGNEVNGCKTFPEGASVNW